ncbi:MAG: YggT family protein [Oscillospiraceae bacterium]|nr:YggT family protein [Oscillospiraceae bacterium]
MHYIILNILAALVVAVLYAMQFLMFGRAIMSWFSPDEDNKVAQFLYFVTEPFVYPIRKVMQKFDFFNNMPIDMSFMAAIIILIIFTNILGGRISF